MTAKDVNDEDSRLTNTLNETDEIREFSEEFDRSLSISSSSNKNTSNGFSSNPLNTEPEDIKTESEPDPKEEPSTEKVKRFVAPKDFDLLKVIGMGAFGKVLQVRNRRSKDTLAMKVISKRLLKRKTSYVENVLAERNILTKIANHPFIVTMHCSFQTREKLFIIMDFCAGGELFLKLGREGIFRERTAAFYLAEITLALEHLHGLKILHRDLKPENILLGSDGHCRLTDFGLAKDFASGESGESYDSDERTRTICGTMEYMAPEMVARKWYGKGADFWSMGCIAYEMLSGRPPFSSNKGSKELFKKIMNERIRMPDGASASACKLLKGLLNRDAGKRLGAARGTMFEMGGVGALKQQPFFSGLDWGKLELKEIEPPEDFSVDNDEDLRHFHDEFVQMRLPRSVKEMSKLDFLPRRCESDNFRGFSFIGENFALPERTESEQEHYWNNIDDDGQSLSECASSVFDDDQMPTTPVPEPPPEKKKRPPRKKKKKQNVPPLETTNETPETPNGPLGPDQINTHSDQRSTQAKDMLLNEESQSFSNGVDPVVATTTRHQISQPSNDKDLITQQNKPLAYSNIVHTRPKAANVPTTNVKTNTLPKTLNPQAHTWSMDRAAKRMPQDNQKTVIPTSAVVIPKQTSKATYKPAAGSWASMAVGKGAPSNPRNTVNQPAATKLSGSISTPDRKLHTKPNVASHAPPQSSPAQSSPLSPDWRHHVVSPRRKVLAYPTTQTKSPIPPPPIPSAGNNLWPSLGDFPPAPGSKGKISKPKAPVGVWGSKG